MNIRILLLCLTFGSNSFESKAGMLFSLQTPNQDLPGSANVRISKERADAFLAKLPPGDPWEKSKDASSLAWGEAATLQTLVNMYEATNDSKYLAEVAMRGDRLLTHRDDKRGVVDGSGKSRPAWSMGFKYVVAEGKLTGKDGDPVIDIKSTPYSQNQLTAVEVRLGTEAGRFTIYAANSAHKRYETFSNLSLDPEDSRFIEKIVNDPMSPYHAKAGEYTDKSNLIRVKTIGKSRINPPAQSITPETNSSGLYRLFRNYL